MNRPRRVRYLTLVFVVASFGVLFIIGNRQIEANTQGIDRQVSQKRIQLAEQQSENLKLKNELSVVDTEAYIENAARTRYGYLKPGELRFVITNPEALYQNGDGSPQLEVVAEGDKP